MSIKFFLVDHNLSETKSMSSTLRTFFPNW